MKFRVETWNLGLDAIMDRGLPELEHSISDTPAEQLGEFETSL